MKYILNQQLWAIDKYGDFIVEGEVRSIQTTIYEANDTFKERHTYIISFYI